MVDLDDLNCIIRRYSQTKMIERIVLTGLVHTGKTTALQRLIEKRPNNFVGIIAPIIKGRRYLLNVSTGEQKCLEVTSNDSDAIFVGNYVFSRKVFTWGRDCLLGQKSDLRDKWLIIDEIGKLELQGEGLSPTATDLILDSTIDKILLVIRDTLMEQAEKNIGVPFKLISKEDLTNFL